MSLSLLERINRIRQQLVRQSLAASFSLLLSIDLVGRQSLASVGKHHLGRAVSLSHSKDSAILFLVPIR